jgi:hypothetical protein
LGAIRGARNVPLGWILDACQTRRAQTRLAISTRRPRADARPATSA